MHIPGFNRRTFMLFLLGGGLGCRDRRAAASSVRRVVSLSPGTTESLYALGAGSLLVGRSRFCDYPAEARSVPSVGGFVDPSFEAILGLAPDLVVGVRGPGLRDFVGRLEARGIGTYFPPTDSMSEITQMFVGLGERLGRKAAGQQLARKLEDKVAGVARALRGKRRPRTLLVFGLKPIVAAGSEGFPGEMLRLAGAENVVRGKLRYPTLGIEKVMSLNPELVIDASGHDGDGIQKHSPGWAQLAAIKSGNLFQLRDERVMRPGPRVGDGLLLLVKRIHPELAL